MREIHIPSGFSDRDGTGSFLRQHYVTHEIVSLLLLSGKLWHLSGFSVRTEMFTSSLTLSVTLSDFLSPFLSQPKSGGADRWDLLNIANSISVADRPLWFWLDDIPYPYGMEWKVTVCLLFIWSSICPETFWTFSETATLSNAAVSKLKSLMLGQS